MHHDASPLPAPPSHASPDASGGSDSIGAARVLADLVCGTTWDGIPPAVRKDACRAILNHFAAALGGCNEATLHAAVRAHLPFGSGTQVRLIGRTERFDLLNGAALNAMASNVHDFCDTHYPTILHPTAPVAPAIGALAQRRPITGAQCLLAFVLGVEVEARIANAISPWHYARGWHITSTCGVFGAAAAAARILDLDAERTVWALATAAAQAGGLVETLGSSAKSISVGNAARNGLMSALLAVEGFDGPASILDGTYGFLRVFGSEADFSCIRGTGDHAWQLSRNACKPYPCGVVLNPVIDACLQIARDADLSAESIARIESVRITGHPLLRQRTDRPEPPTGRQSQVSAQHAVAVVLRSRKAGLAQFSDAAVQDPALRALGSRVRFIDDDGMPVGSARVEVRFGDRPPISAEIGAARGSLDAQMSDADIEAKLRDACEFGGCGIDTSRLIDAVWSLETAVDAGSVFALASPPPA